ncbi:MAG TPA: hypothetical protein VL225_21015 [Vicinamibacterales bacterium]|jgi:hypothetical protein|nr:hypothetical protein [Vicinamibacterales bacterium]
MRRLLLLFVLLTSIGTPSLAQNRAEDEYTRYELLAPETNSFRITYDVTAVTPGAKYFFNPIRKGSEARDESVIDLMTGAPLAFREIGGRQARDAGLAEADLETHYIQVTLARPVPDGGEGRIRILKTYKDPKSYYREGDAIVFNRSLGIKRNAIVLPAGYELLAANVPVQVIEEADGRIAASFLNPYPGEAPLEIRARALRHATAPTPGERGTVNRTTSNTPQVAADAPPPERPMNQIRVTERALQDREIVYFLKQPETHAFSLYHDYTASREGEHQYVNVVRAGSTVSEPSARTLDSGEALKTRTLTGADIAREKIDIPDRVDPDTQVVLIPFTPVPKGGSIRLRISETYTDPARYDLIDGQLMWHRSFGRPRNDMVLPDGWYLTTSSIPAVVSREPDGRIRLSFWNPRPDNVDVFVRGRKR